MQTRFAAWVESYSLPLLKWAMSKTGSRAEAEDLTQEVWLQFFSAVQKEAQSGRAIHQPEHLSPLMLLARAMALHDVGYTTELLAFRVGTLYHPVSRREGEFLTMAYIFR